MQNLLEIDCGDGSDLLINFTYNTIENEKTIVKELIPNGADTFVNEKNKLYYVNLITTMKMQKEIKSQVDAFKHGLFQILPK